jgi:hypothetical protein
MNENTMSPESDKIEIKEHPEASTTHPNEVSEAQAMPRRSRLSKAGIRRNYCNSLSSL